MAALIRPLDFSATMDVAAGACRYARYEADRRWVITLRRLLAHPVAWVRLEATRALAVVGSTADVPALEALVQDPVPEVRQEAAAAKQSITDGVSQATEAVALLEDRQEEQA